MGLRGQAGGSALAYRHLGGRATRRHARTGEAQNVSGDICSTDPAGHVLTSCYHIECKHLANLGLTAAMLRGNGELVRHWIKCAREAEHHGKFPMLIAKQDLYQPVIALPLAHGIFEGPMLVLPQHHCAIYLFERVLSWRYCMPRLNDGEEN